MKKQPVVSVDIIVQRNNKILLGALGKKWKSKKYEWGLPGRELIFGETFIGCVARNLMEETGMKLIKARVTSIVNNFEFGNHYVTLGILTEAKGEPRVMKKDDFEMWKWFEKENTQENYFHQQN